MSNQLRYRVLGSLELEDNAGPLELRGAKQRALLGIFLLHPNEVLTPDRLMEYLWGGAQPSAGRTALAMQVCRLRRLLHAREQGVLETRPNGYVLNVEPSSIDLHRFERQLEDGIKSLKAGAFTAAAETLERALNLWRGRPFEDLAYESCAQAEIERLEDERLLALEERIKAELALGRSAALIGELEKLVRQYPFRERFRGQLMLALYRSGRQAEALDVYQDARRVLREELGLEPGPFLRGLEKSILRQDADLGEDARSQPVEAATALRLHSRIRNSRHICWSCWQAVGHS